MKLTLPFFGDREQNSELKLGQRSPCVARSACRSHPCCMLRVSIRASRIAWS